MKRIVLLASGLILICGFEARAQAISPCTEQALSSGKPCVDYLPSNNKAGGTSATVLPKRQPQDLGMANRPASGPTQGQVDTSATSATEKQSLPQAATPQAARTTREGTSDQ